MEAAAPIVYARSDGPGRLSLGSRLLALAVAGGCLVLLITPAGLTPSRTGVGSHQGLGLPECQFMQRTGLPCPSCGMTTSFTWFVRGNLVASFYVQPMGCLIAAACCICIWAGLYIALTGRPVHRLLLLLPGRYFLMPLLGFALVAWAWKILIHLAGWDGWG